MELGTLKFFDAQENRVMRLQLIKNNGLYYANGNNVRVPHLSKYSVYSLVTDDWIQVLDAGQIDKDVTNAWL